MNGKVSTANALRVTQTVSAGIKQSPALTHPVREGCPVGWVCSLVGFRPPSPRKAQFPSIC